MRTYKWILGAAALLCVISIVGSAWAAWQDCTEPTTTTFDGGGNGSSWTDSNNWDNGVPDSSKCAVIPKEFEVVIPANTTNAACKTLTIEVDEDETGTLKVNQGAVLTLGDGSARTSTVDGKLIVGEDDAPRPARARAGGSRRTTDR